MSGADFLRLGAYFVEFAVTVAAPVLFLAWATWRMSREA